MNFIHYPVKTMDVDVVDVRVVTVLKVVLVGLMGAFLCFGGVGCGKKEALKKEPVYFGVYQSEYAVDFDKTTSILSKNSQLISWDLDFSKDFPKDKCLSVLEQESIPYIQLHPWLWGDDEAIQYTNILDGEWDEYLTQFARDAEVFEYPVFISFAPNYNLEDKAWSLMRNNKDAASFQRAFRYIVTLFRQEGAQNIIWVWQPHVVNFPDQEWNDMWKSFPGNDVVDWVGVSGFFDTKYRLTLPISYEELFALKVRDLRRYFPDKPILLHTEVQPDNLGWLDQLTIYLQSSLRHVNAVVVNLKDSDSKEISSSLKKSFKTSLFKAPVDDLNTVHVNMIEVAKTKTGVELKMAKVQSALQIDGSSTDWTVPTPLPHLKLNQLDQVTLGALNWKGEADVSLDVSFAYDDTNLYVLSEWQDDMPLQNSHERSELYRGDSIEFLFYMSEVVLDVTSPNVTPQKKVTYFGISPGDGSIRPFVWNFGTSDYHPSTMIRASEVVEGGFKLEMKVPWTSFGLDFGGSVPPSFNVMVSVNDFDAEDTLSSKLVYNGDLKYNSDMNDWPVLELID